MLTLNTRGRDGGAHSQCGPAGRRRQLTARKDGAAAAEDPVPRSKRRDTNIEWRQTQDFAAKHEDPLSLLSNMSMSSSSRLGVAAGSGDTAAVGHDWVIGGTLAAGVMQSEMLLTTQNLTAIKHFLPMLHRISNFMETR
jgi:hypothetical protein